MEPIQPIDNTNLRTIIGNNPINIPNANINRISGPSVISTIDRPNVRSVEAPVVRGLEVPAIDAPNTTIKYPVINVPTQEEFDAAVRAEKDKQAQEQTDKSRGLPDSPTPPTPAVAPKIEQPITPQIEVPAQPITTPTLLS